uniref:Uncharacterized protein n=1 Tax=Vitis vinifera TaxID=29760 RepID=A5C4E4_VITVI|nr:hypothetical protein VITISV_001895 [Vitis vinifera]
MARTRGAKSSSPSTCLRIPRDAPVQDSISESSRPHLVSPSVKDAPTNPPARRYNTRRSLTITGASSSRGQKSGVGPPKKKAKVSEPIDLTESSSEPESEPTPSPPPDKKSPPLAKRPQPSQTPARETQIPSGMTPESDIVHTLSRGASSRHYILRKELSPSMFFIDALLRHNIFLLQHWVQRRGVLLEALYRISEGYFFGPHHLIMAALLYFEEKVHRKKLLRADAIPLLFPRLLCQILEHLGYPAEHQHERRHICREIFTLDKWTSMTVYGGANQGAPAGPEHPEQPEEPIDIPTNTQPPAPVVASSEPTPKVPPSTPQATPQPPPIIPPTLEPSPSVEPRIAIPIIEYRGLCHTFQALATSQSILT